MSDNAVIRDNVCDNPSGLPPFHPHNRALREVLVQLGIDARPRGAEPGVHWLDLIDREIERASHRAGGFRGSAVTTDSAAREALVRIGALCLHGIAAIDTSGGAAP